MGPSYQTKSVFLKKWSLIVAGILFISFFGVVLVMSPNITIMGVLFLSAGFLFFRTGKFSLKQIVVFLLLTSVLLPPVSFFAELPAISIELIIILIAWLLLLSGRLSTGKGVILRWSSTNKWFFLFGMSIFISIVYAALAKSYYPINRDFFEFAKLLKYFLIFQFVVSLNISPKELRKYYFILLGVFFCSALVGFAQYWNLLNINSIVTPYYVPTEKIEIYLQNRRIAGTVGNPNEFGALMVLANCLVLTGILWLKGKRTKLVLGGLFGTFSYVIILSCSRAALISFFVASVFILFFKYPLSTHRRAIWKLFLVIPLLLILIFILVQLAPPLFFFRINTLFDLSTNTSWQGKLVTWNDTLQIWRRSPVFGWGPAKATMTTSIDNEWLLVLRRYGIVGLAIFVSLLGSFYFSLSRIFGKAQTNIVRVFSTGLQAGLVAYVVSMIVAALYHSIQSMSILMVLLGLAYSQGNFRKIRVH